jgi:inosine-uridine nucleoside N-ribohydrolase
MPHIKPSIKILSRITGARLDELNFSCAPTAAYHVFKHGQRISLMTTQLTLQAWFGEQEIEALQTKDHALSDYLVPILNRFIDEVYGQYLKDRGFFNWDLTTAVYLTNPELFETSAYRAKLSEENLTTGLIPEDLTGSATETRVLDVPTRILDLRAFNRLLMAQLDGIAANM